MEPALSQDFTNPTHASPGSARAAGPLESAAPAGLKGLARVAGVLAEPVYAAGLWVRSRGYDLGLGVRRVRVPVISVGNLSLGGTGKTPMVAHLVRRLADMGRHPAIALRGYGGHRAHGGSDEADLYRRLFPGVPVLVGADRHATISAQLADADGPRVDWVLLDDGFQHRRLHRDADVVLLDATSDPFAERLFPRGWLREPVGALGRAGAVVITHAEAAHAGVVDRLRARLAERFPGLPVAVARHAWVGLRRAGGAAGPWPRGFGAESGELGRGGEDEAAPVEWLKDRGVVLACAIGNPRAFIEAARAHTRVLATLVLPDHDPFAGGTVDRLAGLAADRQAEAILVTDKDWSKLRRVSPTRWPCPVVRPELALRFDAGEEGLLAMIRDRLGAGAPAGGGRGES